ncbi:IclR family transcriptional regulator [Nocardia cerradoensis]|uniref:IclR family transcriptional regulator n=1 Tax=Nocardia cerradoensis TaxID=85688 RepID=UPI0005859429|nr:helix-turn-helix domain-containing protein [Nocardia cerradoensis]NKY48563.1 helix-turn-helix domain-containing protein [Nocardia cerradoensis]
MPTGNTGRAESSPPTRRVVSVVELLAAHDGALTSAEIADTLGLSRSTMGAILGTLEETGWVRRLPDLGYEPGPALLVLGGRLRDRLRDHDRVEAELRRLAERVGCGAALTSIAGSEVIFVAVAGGPGLIPAGIEAGTRIPLRPPAGAAVLAHAGLPAQRAWLQQAPPERRAEFEQVLETVRALGYCAWGLDAASLPTLRVLAEVVDHLSDRPADKALRERVLALLATIGGTAHSWADLDSDRALPISYLTVPVFDGERVAMEVQIGPLSAAVGAVERAEYVRETVSAARRIAAAD